MTREQEVEIISERYGANSLMYGKLHNDTLKGLLKHYQKGFVAGVKWADENPKSPWIKYKDEKPEVGVEVIAFHPKWVDEDFNPNGTRVGFLGGDGFISAFWWDYQDCYETISKLHCESNKDFYRSHIDNTEPEFWLPIPKFSKSLKE